MDQSSNSLGGNLSSLKLDNLPKVLNFDDSKNPLLHQTAQRIIDTAKKNPSRAEAVAATYEKLAEENLEEQLDESRQNAPLDYRRQQIIKARGGLLINLARIWRDAGLPEKCRQALDRAIAFARANRWASIVTALENERQKLLANN
jgi:hypothetical protein